MIVPLWIPPMVFFLRFVLGYRIDNVAEIREQYRQLREESDLPILICPNHLTLIDSVIIAWALVPWWRYLIHFDLMPWNTPERKNFARTGVTRVLVFIAKCIPISRGGERAKVANALVRVTHLLNRGETALVFPEGTRSRTGRVNDESIAWGVGRIVASTPGCRVLCIYSRGDTQESWGSIPNMGDHFDMRLECFEPKSDCRGARLSRDLVSQIVARLAHMEEAYFNGR
ncbi:MAG: 1-acyl-sn-glycerol-3-phosphate acyltransferase [Deltaproteobacteria bacterium]|nr:1-acyl-sn-glycerol-3-phosphate acyltransferase [Deltaproteobacteria bacterium]MBW2723608.1 1-acyl-sn-glycerol-3-phosphate acyltransferase [Deltaproteobacteria bacterium]